MKDNDQIMTPNSDSQFCFKVIHINPKVCMKDNDQIMTPTWDKHIIHVIHIIHVLLHLIQV